jgi:hypothetical protein
VIERSGSAGGKRALPDTVYDCVIFHRPSDFCSSACCQISGAERCLSVRGSGAQRWQANQCGGFHRPGFRRSRAACPPARRNKVRWRISLLTPAKFPGARGEGGDRARGEGIQSRGRTLRLGSSPYGMTITGPAVRRDGSTELNTGPRGVSRAGGIPANS